MRITTITVRMSGTINDGNFGNSRTGYELTAELAPEDDPEQVTAMLQQRVRDGLVQNHRLSGEAHDAANRLIVEDAAARRKAAREKKEGGDLDDDIPF